MPALLETSTSAESIFGNALADILPPNEAPIVDADGPLNGCEDTRPELEIAPELGRFADELGELLGGDTPIFLRAGEVVTLDDDRTKLKTIKPHAFRTFIEQYVRVISRTEAKGETVIAPTTLSKDQAEAVLHAPQFRRHLRPIRRLSPLRMPMLRGGELELLPEGYDAPSQTYTLRGPNFRTDMSIDAAVALLRSIYAQTKFKTPERDLGTTIALSLTLFCRPMIAFGEHVPGFAIDANVEGCGKGTLVQLALLSVLGVCGPRAWSDSAEEQRKVLMSHALAGGGCLLLDNKKGRLDSASLEAFMTCGGYWTDRLLGGNQEVVCEFESTIVATANGMSVSPDLRRRTLSIELFSNELHPTFQKPIEISELRALRPEYLSALYAIVRFWHEQGQPAPSLISKDFPAWSRVIGGMLSAIGHPSVSIRSAGHQDPDSSDIRSLVEVVARREGQLSCGDLAELIIKEGLFEDATQSAQSLVDLNNASRNRLFKIVAGYLGRDFEFANLGRFRWLDNERKGHARRYRAHKLA